MSVEETNENTNSANLRYESKESNGSGKHRYNNNNNNSTMKGQMHSTKQRMGSSNDSDYHGKHDSLSRSGSMESGEADSRHRLNNRR